MTLDEMIAWLADEACWALGRAQIREVVFLHGESSDVEHRERAATLLTIENALRAYKSMRDTALQEARQMLAEETRISADLIAKYGDKLRNRAAT
jgi:hypothetical protein